MTGNIIEEASGTTVQVVREWQASSAFVADLNQWNTATAAGTGFNFLTAYTGVTGTDTQHTGGTLTLQIAGNGAYTMGGCGAGTYLKADGTGCGSPGGGTVGSSDVTGQSTSQTSTAVATAPGGGNYNLRYYADVNTACTTGANTVSFTLSWTDATAARTLQTGSLPMGSSTSASYITGEIPIRVASGNVTYTSTVSGSCGSGTSEYDVHMVLTQ